MADKPAPPPARRAIPIAPTEDAWRAMSEGERARFLDEVLDALSDPRAAMSEGRPHKKVKKRSLDMLGLHFGVTGRVVYLAEEMAVVYPGEEVFTPDVLAVVGVAEPEDDTRMAWVVADEGRGLDLVLEVLHRGNRKKDLVDNVERYARLGIPEYFVYDYAQQRIRGYRLPPQGAKRYQPIVPQGGRYASSVLGIDLAIQEGTLRFFHGMAELFGSADLIRRLSGMVQDSESKAEQAAIQVEQAESKAEQAQSKAEQAAIQVEQAESKAEQAQSKAERAMAGLRLGILGTLDARGLAVEAGLAARIEACDDPTTLQTWLLRALSAKSAEEALASDVGG